MTYKLAMEKRSSYIKKYKEAGHTYMNKYDAPRLSTKTHCDYRKYANKNKHEPHKWSDGNVVSAYIPQD